MHIHIGALVGLLAFLHILLYGTIWRVIAVKLKDNAVGQAMAFMY